MNNPRSSPVLRAKTLTFSHHGVAFSPFFDDRLALASGANFGLVGNGRLHVLQLAPSGLGIVKWFDTQDCVYDVAWNEAHENQVIAACGNGSLRLFDITLEGLPVKAWHEHSAEIMSVDWNNLEKDRFATSSWDQTVKIWSLSRSTSLLTLPAHHAQIYSAVWSPNQPTVLATCAADGYLKVFDIRTSPAERPVLAFQASPTDVLNCDWNKYDVTTIATAGKDMSVRVWDLRGSAGACTGEMRGHSLAVRKVQWSPHHRDKLASTSYDMTCRTWTTKPPSPSVVHTEHTEFVMGVAWALFDEGLLASCAWDEEIHLYRG